MTKSAKQDAKEVPAQAAATESAATTDADAAESADAGETAQDAAAVFEGDTHEDNGKPELDDVKAKFREALDRKRQAHAEGQGKGAHESGKVNGAHGPAASRRNFRRKSG